MIILESVALLAPHAHSVAYDAPIHAVDDIGRMPIRAGRPICRQARCFPILAQAFAGWAERALARRRRLQ